MLIITLLVSIVLSIFSTAVMSYISMATPIGPWIALTLVLCAMLIFKIFGHKIATQESIALAVSAGSIGGILATACGFSFPTLYFLDPSLFNSWMAHPLFFSIVLSSLALVAGLFGMWIANVIEHKMIIEEKLAFPIGQLIHKMIAAHHNIRKACELMIGFVSTFLFCILQDGFYAFKGIIPKAIPLIPPTTFGVLRIPLVRLDIWPMLWAIGFVTGHVITLPLFVGAIAKIILVDPLNHLFFSTISSMEFILAFCSGMVLSGALFGLLDTPKSLWKAVNNIISNRKQRSMNARYNAITAVNILELGIVLLLLLTFFTYFGFSPLVQLYLIVVTFICTYQIAMIAGKIGLALLGRFATFVMVPAMLLFNINSVQIVFIATFVEICGGVATDILFGRKVAHLAHIAQRKIKAYQYLGLIVSCVCIGAFFWLLIHRFQLGSADLFAQRAQARQLLIHARHFDYYVLLLGLIFGFVLKYIKINPMLVLGGLLMPLNISLGLIVGGLCTLFTHNKEDYYPFWSGVYASNSIWMIIKALF